MSNDSVLVGDIGGTHARFAVLEQGELREWRDLPDDCASFTEVLRHYLDALGRHRIPDIIALAVAGPVADGKVSLRRRNNGARDRPVTPPLRGLRIAAVLSRGYSWRVRIQRKTVSWRTYEIRP